MKKKVPKEISDHFRKLGKKSWAARKEKILKAAEDNGIVKNTTKK